jgi:hypothetical protein
VDLDVADGEIRIGHVVFTKAHHRAGEVGTAGVIPKSGLDDLHGAPIVGLQIALVKLLEPERLRLHFARRRGRILAHRSWRQIRMRRGFHRGNLIPSELRP